MKTNREGLTFEEWVCAAGEARFDSLWSEPLIAPYSRSYTFYPDHTDYKTNPRRCFTDPRKAKKRTTVYYSKKVRDAWRNGEDPTEWRSKLAS